MLEVYYGAAVQRRTFTRAGKLVEIRSLNNLGIRMFRFLHFNSLFVHTTYTSNKAAGFYMRVSVTSLHITAFLYNNFIRKMTANRKR